MTRGMASFSVACPSSSHWRLGPSTLNSEGCASGAISLSLCRLWSQHTGDFSRCLSELIQACLLHVLDIQVWDSSAVLLHFSIHPLLHLSNHSSIHLSVPLSVDPSSIFLLSSNHPSIHPAHLHSTIHLLIHRQIFVEPKCVIFKNGILKNAILSQIKQNSKRSMHPYVHSWAIHDSQDTERT